MTPRENVRLADHCTLGVGGPARYFVEAHDEAAVLEALDWARARRLPVRVLGGGSNLYCGVSLRAPSAGFDQVRDGRRLWPAVYSRDWLDPRRGPCVTAPVVPCLA